jgi:maleylacetoacetate isomerase
MAELRLPPHTTYTLYTYFASSCAARIRIAFHLKNIPFEARYVDMDKDNHQKEDYLAINPSGSIPTLVVTQSYAHQTFEITQSIAILEYIEEVFSDRLPLLPPLEDKIARVRVKELVAIVSQDMFPLGNSKIAMRVRAIRDSRDDQVAFVTKAMTEGFDAYEVFLRKYNEGKMYSVSDTVSLADVCLVPQVQMARFFGMSIEGWTLIYGLVKKLETLEAFRKGSWRDQGDTPDNHRLKDEL